MDTLQKQIALLLAQIETELAHLGMWSDAPPTRQALGSRMPFCYDTLEIGAWLQWVFIPKIRHLLDARQPLPDECHILPYALEVLDNRSLKAGHLITLIEMLDRSINDRTIIH